jgi:hypothetical protein
VEYGLKRHRSRDLTGRRSSAENFILTCSATYRYILTIVLNAPLKANRDAARF